MRSHMLRVPKITSRSGSTEELIELDDGVDYSSPTQSQSQYPDSPIKRPDASHPSDNEQDGDDNVLILLPSDDDEPYILKYNFFSNEDEKEKGLIYDIVRMLSYVWKKMITVGFDHDRESYLKTSVRALLLYIGFVIVVCIVVLGVDINSSRKYKYTKVMKDLIVNQPGLNEKTSAEDFWKYVEGDLLEALYENPDGYILGENKLIGLPRLRQVRVPEGLCKISDDIRILNVTFECYVEYSKSDEDTNVTFTGTDGKSWPYKTSDELIGQDISGAHAVYGGGGYVQQMSAYKEDAELILKLLKNNRWIDRGTRGVFIDFTVYNANINLFCVITLVFEFPPAGGMVPMSYFKTIEFLRYHGDAYMLVLACEIFFFFFILYYTVEEVIEMRMIGIDYFYNVWNLFDALIVVMGYITLIFILYASREVERVIKILLKTKTGDQSAANFSHLSMMKDDFTQFDSVFIFLVMIKIFKYISFNKASTQLLSTLSRCAKDITAFCVMFFIVFLAYAQWGYLMFGGLLKEFSTFQSCIYTLFRIILGDFNFPNMEQARRIMGPIYFITYMFFVFFVLINMFLAIICDTYAEVKEELSQEEDRLELGDLLRRGYRKVMEKMPFSKEKIVDLQEALGKADDDGDELVDKMEFRCELKKRGYGDEEIAEMFSMHDLDDDGVLDPEEQQKMHDYLEGKKTELNVEMIPPDEFEEKFYRSKGGSSSLSLGENDEHGDDLVSLGEDLDEGAILQRRLDRLELSMGNVMSNICQVISKMDDIVEERAKRQSSMAALMDCVRCQVGNDNNTHAERMDIIVQHEMGKWAL